MATTTIGQVRFGALADLPPMPQHYHIEAMRDTPNGVRVDVHFKGARIFEIAVELHYKPEYDDPCGTRYAARVVQDKHREIKEREKKEVVLNVDIGKRTALSTAAKFGL